MVESVLKTHRSVSDRMTEQTTEPEKDHHRCTYKHAHTHTCTHFPTVAMRHTVINHPVAHFSLET